MPPGAAHGVHVAAEHEETKQQLLLPCSTRGEAKFPSAKCFPECQKSGTRGSHSSPSVALGEELHSEKRGFPECQKEKDTRGS
jgi:hypothetical protein